MKDPDESFFGKGIVTHDMSINPSNKMTYMSQQQDKLAIDMNSVKAGNRPASRESRKEFPPSTEKKLQETKIKKYEAQVLSETNEGETTRHKQIEDNQKYQYTTFSPNQPNINPNILPKPIIKESSTNNATPVNETI